MAKCPKCGSERIIYNGTRTLKSGKQQKLQCLDCHLTFHAPYEQKQEQVSSESEVLKQILERLDRLESKQSELSKPSETPKPSVSFEEIKICPECKSSDLVRDFDTKEIVCGDCGLVLLFGNSSGVRE